MGASSYHKAAWNSVGGGEGKANAADTLFREALVGASGPAHTDCFTPLVAAVSCGNPTMFDKVRDAYERGAGGDGDGKNRHGGGSASTVAATVTQTANPTAAPEGFLDTAIELVNNVLPATKPGFTEKRQQSAPETALLRRSCSWTSWKPVLDTMNNEPSGVIVKREEWKEAVAKVSKEWQIRSVAEAEEAAEKGAPDGLRFERVLDSRMAHSVVSIV